MANNDDKIKRYNNWSQRANSASSMIMRERKNWEDFYFNDVDNTLSQLTKRQLNAIKKTFNVPVSTKICYAIVEQMLSFLTGTKPFPRLVGATDNDSDQVIALEQGYQGLWYESKANNQLTLAVRDALAAGSGYLMVDTNTFYQETAFNVKIKHVSWQNIFVDPDSKLHDFSDAQYILWADIMLKDKASKEYDIDIDEIESVETMQQYGVLQTPDYLPGWDNSNDSHNKYCLVRQLFIKEEMNVYVGDANYISTKRPIPTEIPNEDKQQLLSQIDRTQQAVASGQNAISASQTAASSMPNSALDTVDGFAQFSQGSSVASDQTQSVGSQIAQLNSQAQTDAINARSMPDTIPAFHMTLEDGSVQTVKSISKIRKKRIRKVLMVGNEILEESILPMEVYPIIHFAFNHRLSPNKTYSVVHFTRDLVKAMNKYWSLLLYDIHVHGQRKLLAPQGAIVNVKEFEEGYSTPGSVNIYVPDPSLPDAGRPTVIEPSPLNESISFVLNAFLQLIEYVTGINSVMQGSAEGAPNTMGGLQSLQAFGTQRIKLFARSMETSLEQLALVAIQFLQAYAPVDKVIKYFDGDGNAQTVSFFKAQEDIAFKVRVDIVNSLPTYKQLFAQLLGSVAGQTKNPHVADALTKAMLEAIDAPESKQLIGDIDTIKNLESQLQQAQQQLDTLQKQYKQLENNMVQKEVAHRIDLAFEEQKTKIDSASKDAQQQAEKQAEQTIQKPTNEEVPF